MESIVWICFVLTLLNCTNGENNYKTVQTNNGDIRGQLQYTLYKNVSYYAFLGIPYAEKPLDELRFKAPVPITPWKPKILDAFQYGNSCIQQSAAIGNSGPVSEDCLYLNIFVAEISPFKKLAVIFYIHGGGFSEGSGNNFFFGPDFLMEQGVIVVTVNYRLGAFGFMSLDTKHYSGNMGLKDQHMALKWTHRNIPSFGGDKRRITVMGQSAGAVSAHYHLLMPQSRKLIRRVICLSGSALSRLAYSDTSHVKKMFAFAQHINGSIEHVHQLVDFLKSVPAQTIVNETSQDEIGCTLIFDWAPSIEKKNAYQSILTRTPDEMYQHHLDVNVDTMFGYTNYECLDLVSNDISNSTRLNEILDEFKIVLPVHGLRPQFESKPYRKILNKVRQFYFGNATSEHEKKLQYVNMISDLNMVAPIDRAIKTQAKQSKRRTYYYQFSVDGKLNYSKRQLNFKWPGATHCDDLCYIFRCHAIDSVYEEIQKTMHIDKISKMTHDTIQHMSSMYANFAKHGRPTIHGKPTKGYHKVRQCKVNFLDITNDAMMPGVSPKKAAVKFWRRINDNAESLIR